jgi:DNA-binding PadR family transcriptional regulator
MAAAGGPSKLVTYKEIDKHLEKLQRKSYSRAYIYRHLQNLEKEGYISSEQEIGKTRQYQILESEIIKMLERKKEEVSSELLEKKQESMKKLELLQTTNPEELAHSLFNELAGLTAIRRSIIIEGIENVRNMVIREFGSSAKPGDVIRVIAPASLLDGGLTGPGMAEISLMRRAEDDVKILGVMIPKHNTLFSTELIASFTKNIGPTFTSFVASGNISLKVAKENIKTYRMVSLNRDKMLLYLTHAAESDIAALVHRKDNPGLIDDAVDTFDRLANEGIDVIEMVKQMIASAKES